MEGAPFQWGRHHSLISHTLDRIILGEITRLIVTMPPGYTKTALATILFSALAFAVNERARMLHTSYSDNLVIQNGAAVRDVMASDLYRPFFPYHFRVDQKAKANWKLTAGGEFYGASMGGQITGRARAGRADDGFTGAMVIDDPINPKRATAPSGLELREVNNIYHNTLRSRLFTPRVPCIVIMQRLHYEDLAGYLLTGGSGENWHHLCLPVEIVDGWAYPHDTWTHGIPIEHDLAPGPLWPFVHDERAIDLLREPASVFQAQYMQQPLRSQGSIFKEDHFQQFPEIGNLEYRMIYADTAFTSKTTSDFTVFQCWGKRKGDGKALILDQVRVRMDAEDLKPVARAFWAKHKERDGVAMGSLRGMKIENKASGTQLIQGLQRDGIPVLPIERAIDKVTRANDVVPAFATGLVEHPPKSEAPWLAGWQAELLAFPDGTYDDQCDPTFDAVSDMCTGSVTAFDVL